AFWAACAAVLVGVRLCHLNVLWVDEAYGMAAARRMLEGAALYRDIWFDKPPLYAWIYLPWGAGTGWPLRLAGALFALFCCWMAKRTAETLFGPREGWYAAAAMAFFLSFDHAAAVLSLAPDLLLIPFALAAVWSIAAGRPSLAAACAAGGLLAHTKALILLPLILLWRPHAWRRILPVYAASATLVWLAASGWRESVWEWGALYSRDSFVQSPVAEGMKRTANWAGFHAALVIGACFYFARKDAHRWRLAAWLGLGLVQVAAGARFFPRYYLALLPVLAVAAARGFCLVPNRWRAALLALALAIPAVRFGGRHIATLRGDPAAMRDLSLYLDCRAAAEKIQALAHSGDTLLVWGYRPELNVLARLPGATPFLDSQPLTGVIADRHLTSSLPTAPSVAQRHREQLAQTGPTFIADGLGPYNPTLAIGQYEDLRDWFTQYELVAQTAGTRIYRRR
ncbi:MAG: glycosyltransferase family 39 protein, partial [Acidobacteriales bacterium]|nr:glycosyltransferase family 39 protein [Terriglobales bacterium]